MNEFARTHARTTDPSTSKAAAASLDVRSQLTKYEEAFRYAYTNGQGLTAEEAAHASGLGTDGGNYTKRVSDLINRGIIEPTGETRRGSSGRKQRVLKYVSQADREGRLL